MQTFTPKLSLLLRRVALLLPLLCLSWLTQARTQLDYATISYQTSGTANREVRFRVSEAGDLGTQITTVGASLDGGLLDFGDGTAPVPVNIMVTSTNSNNFYGEATIAHTYVTAGNYTATVTNCCRRLARNNGSQPIKVSTLVMAGSANDSPVATGVPIFDLAFASGPQTFRVPAADPDGDALTYSLATAEDVGNSSFVNPPATTVDPSTGIISVYAGSFGGISTTQAAVYNLVIKVSDGKTSVLVDHIIRVSGRSTRNAVFIAPTPADGQVFTVAPGQPVSFTVQATYSTPAFLSLNAAYGLPPGAQLTPALPRTNANGNSVQTTFTWTPTTADIGTRVINFAASSDSDGSTSTAVVIQVVGAETPPPVCDPAANRPVANADRFTACGPLTITEGQLLSNDTDPLGRLFYVGSVGNPTNGTLVQSGGRYTFTPTPGFTGTASFTYQVLVSGGGLSYPNVASPATGHYYEFVISPVTSPGICWAEARRLAAQRSYNGLQGYLATITSADEAALLAGSYSTKDNSKSYWIGASDSDVEGEWRWKTGPEAGQLFWRGGPAGTAVGFSNWAPGEPNDYKNQYRPAGEDYGQLYGSSGLWNDVDECSTGASVFGYVIEYGGLEACTPQLYATGTVTIEVAAPTPAPVANPDFYTYSRGPKQQLFLTEADLLRNDTDPLGRPLQVRDISTPSVGQFSVFNNPVGGALTYNYSPPTGFVGQATFTYLLQLAGPVLALPATGHYYEYVRAPGICWADAQKAAAARSYQGMGGYLATITSAAETDFLKRFEGRSWFGASDEAVEGEWRWKTGPEAGQLFWRGGPDGTAVSYAKWSPGQPDNFQNQFRPAGEDYGMVYGGSGLWNDLANCGDGGPVDGYLVEYGGLEACTPVLYSVGTVTVEVPYSPYFTVMGASTALQALGESAAPATLEAAPNPSGGQFRLRVTAATDGPAQLDLYDLQGRRVKAVFTGSLRAGEVRELSVEAPELASGIYLVRLQSGQQVQHLRVAIQK